jgi:hypothetical protein
MIRIYVAPTLTAQIGVAICLGAYITGKGIPSPLADIGGNCIVMAIKPQCKNQKTPAALNNPNETYLPRTQDLSTESCIQDRKGEAATKSGYGSTPFDSAFGKMEIENAVYPTTRKELSLDKNDYSLSTEPSTTNYPTSMPNTNLLGVFELEGSSHNNGEITIGGVRIAPGDLSKNKVKS